MTKVVCTSCGEMYKGPFRLSSEERLCPCGGVRVLPSQAKPRKPLAKQSAKRQAEGRRPGLKRTVRKETAAEKRARRHFNKTVKSWPCWFSWHRECEHCEGTGGEHHETQDGHPVWVECEACGGDGRHHCDGPKDAHHLVPKDFLRRMFKAVLPEPEFVAILHNPKLGAPICRKAHEAIESGKDRIYFEDLSDACLEYVSTLPDFVLIRLENECPKREPVTHREEVAEAAA